MSRRERPEARESVRKIVSDGVRCRRSHCKASSIAYSSAGMDAMQTLIRPGTRTSQAVMLQTAATVPRGLSAEPSEHRWIGPQYAVSNYSRPRESDRLHRVCPSYGRRLVTRESVVIVIDRVVKAHSLWHRGTQLLRKVVSQTTYLRVLP